ncbi:hypothetical protein VE04_00878 [Pseudogymnoascus sp. 24MN13]|nr:hypothetical protein VE04_00878 [Pseudogymnoascus sp. 24MN13]
MSMTTGQYLRVLDHADVEDTYDPECHFCVIGKTAKPSPNPTIAASPVASAYLVLATHSVVGFLETAPMSRGHIELLPRDARGEDQRSLVGGERGVGVLVADCEWQVGRADDQACALPYHPGPRPEMKSVYGETRDPSEMLSYEKRRDNLEEALSSKMQDEKSIEACQLIRAALKKEILRMKLSGKIAEGDDEWDLWSMDDGNKVLQL